MISTTFRTSLRAMLLVSLPLIFGGCVSKDMTDLEDYVSQVLSRKGGNIEPLPPIKPSKRYLYQAGDLGLRDPFQSILADHPEIKPPTTDDDANQQQFATEILTHNREELENFELDSLRMVGVLEMDAMFGIIRDQAGVVHRVKVGNYIGRNYGKITNIQEDKIDIREIIKNPTGQWEERPVELAMSDE